MSARIVKKMSISAPISPIQIRMARAGAGLTIRELAQITGLNKATIVRIESGMSVQSATIETVEKALIDHGAEFYRSEDGQRAAVTFPIKKDQKCD